MRILMLTCDEYAWIVPVSLHFFKKYWPDNPYEIEIVTESKHIDGKVYYGGKIQWADRLINYLKQSEENKFLLILEDYLLCRTVNTKEIQHAEEYCKDNIGAINLSAPDRYKSNYTIKSNIKGFREYPLDGKYSISWKPVIYQKQYLLDILKEGETLWNTEIRGSRRLGRLKDKWRLLWTETSVINYSFAGLLHSGRFAFKCTKWLIEELLNISNKLVYIDVGELGWSLYLSAHLRWLKENTDSQIVVIGLPDRRCLYKGLAEEFIEVPRAFYKKYDLNKQDSIRIRKVSWDELNGFFFPYVPSGYRFAEYKEYPNNITGSNRIFAPYEYTKRPEKRSEILIFPRCRSGLWARRNLSESFYVRMIKRLCDEFPRMNVRTIGTKKGAYSMKVKRDNYINWVGEGETLQDLINKCQSAVAAVGSQSAPPKISLLQGVPTFMIGHQENRQTEKENWMNTKVGFYRIKKNEYETFGSRACINAVIDFVKEVK